MDKLIESYKILTHLGSQIFFFIEVHKTYIKNETTLNEIKFEGHYTNLPFAKAISGNHLNYLLILANSYLDEYNQYFTAHKNPQYAKRISYLKKLNKPVLQRIAKWKHLKNYRNHILAHNYRINDISIFSNSIDKINFNCPHTNSEIILLAELIRLININIAFEFPELLDDKYYKETILDRISFDYNEVNIDKEIESVTSQINKIRATLNSFPGESPAGDSPQ